MRSQRFIAFFLVLITVLSTTAFNFPLVGKFQRNVDHHVVDTVLADSLFSNADTLPSEDVTDHPDTVPMSESDSLLLNLDSLKAQFDREHGIETNQSKAIQWNDSVAAAEDSIQKSKKKSALDAPVVYTAKDSMTFFMDTKTAYLYGSADVKYQNIDLTSENIHMNMDSSTVHATYGLDSLGNMYGKPIFKEGSDEYKTKTISYNFKTKKGFITDLYTEQEEGFITSEESKKSADGVYYTRGGTYTTCDEEHPHFYIRMSRMKVRPGKSVFSGPAWLVVEDVPLPLALPFAYFPITSTYSSR